MKMFSETCIAPVNIAVIKYWGKRNDDLILPVNDSISMTLCTDQMCAKTTVAASSTFKENKLWLNGEDVPFESNQRIARCLEQLKRIAAKKTPKFPVDWKLHVCSENNFPTAAGLASSAAGYACLVYTIASLYGIEGEDLTPIARLGSGSACRSLHGGFVQWIKGELDNGLDSIAVQIQPSSHWSNMRMLILVAIDQKNFEKFAEITIKDSNQFHSVCLDTYPPCVYMTDLSHAISDFVHKYNEFSGEMKVAYTFDAGPNACLYLLENDVPSVLAAINKAFPNDNSTNVEYIQGLPIDIKEASIKKCAFIDDKIETVGHNLLKYIIHTKIGEGPRKLNVKQSLLNEQGLPK